MLLLTVCNCIISVTLLLFLGNNNDLNVKLLGNIYKDFLFFSSFLLYNNSWFMSVDTRLDQKKKWQHDFKQKHKEKYLK